MEQVGVASFQRCPETLTGRAVLFVELIAEEYLAESPDVVVAVEGQNVTSPSEL